MVHLTVFRLQEWRAASLAAGSVSTMPQLAGTSWQVFGFGLGSGFGFGFGREADLGPARGAHHAVVVAVARGLAELGAVGAAARLESVHLLG